MRFLRAEDSSAPVQGHLQLGPVPKYGVYPPCSCWGRIDIAFTAVALTSSRIFQICLAFYYSLFWHLRQVSSSTSNMHRHTFQAGQEYANWMTYLTFLLSWLPLQHDDLLRGLVQVVAQPFALPEKASDLALQSLFSLIHDVDLEQNWGAEKRNNRKKICIYTSSHSIRAPWHSMNLILFALLFLLFLLFPF